LCYINALGEIGDKSSIESLTELIVNDDNLIKTVATALEKLGDNEWIQTVNSDPWNIEKIREVMDRRKTEILMEDLRSDKMHIKTRATVG